MILLGGNPLLVSVLLLAWDNWWSDSLTLAPTRQFASAIHYFPPEKYNLYRYAHTRTCVGAFCFGINLCFGNNPAKRPSLRSKLVAERRLNYRCKTDYVRSRFAERNPTRAGSYMGQFLDLFFMVKPYICRVFV